MILTCPECATSYFVDGSKIPPQGRTVKCSNCGARWTATPETPPEEKSQIDLDMEALEAPSPAEPEDSSGKPGDDDYADIPPGDDADPELPAHPGLMEFVAEPVPSALLSDPPPLPASAPDPDEGVRKARRTLLVVAAIFGCFILVAVVALLLRSQVVRLWPAASAAYTGVGLPDADVGMLIEGVRAEPGFQNGRPVLSVTGTIRNLKDKAATSPPLRLRLLDKAGKPLLVKIARPVDAAIPAHAQRHFAVPLTDPPAGVDELEVKFDMQSAGTRETPAKAAPTAAHQPEHGPAAPHPPEAEHAPKHD